MAKKEHDIRRLSKSRKLLPCRLTEPELLNYGAELGSVIQDIQTEEDRQASLKQELKARLASLEAKRTELASKITRKEELRDVQVEYVLDFTDNVHREVRLDTGDVVKERQITDDERQEHLPLDGRKT